MKITNEFYDFINIYKLIIKHCIKKKHLYEAKIFYLNNELYFQIFDKIANNYVYNNSIFCNTCESTFILNTIANDFVLNYHITLSAFSELKDDDIIHYYSINQNNTISCKGDTFYNDNNQMKIHELSNSIFTLKIYYYNGITELAKKIHRLALDKINNTNIDKVLIKKV